jgi:DnaJ-class molecular chaperone
MPNTLKRQVVCAFCQGSGTDPFGILSSLTRCQVCDGLGEIEATLPFVRCGACAGSGIQPHHRLTCSACGGRGVHTVPEHRQICPDCNGKGLDPDSEVDLPCSMCNGSGQVSA